MLSKRVVSIQMSVRNAELLLSNTLNDATTELFSRLEVNTKMKSKVRFVGLYHS